jgi:hypothetical protein
VVLNHPPPEEWAGITGSDLTGRADSAILGVELEARTAKLETWRESLGEVNLSEVLVNFEKRIARLEREAGFGETPQNKE